MTVIDLSKLENRYINLSLMEDEIKFVGEYTGDRIVVSGASGKSITFEGVTIESTRKEPDGDALVFSDHLEDCSITGLDNTRIVYGGITFWNPLKNVLIAGFNIYYANVGIRASQDHANENLDITACKIVAPRREGIYIGPHYAQEHKSRHIEIFDNEILYAGWDAIQVNAWMVQVYNNRIVHPATLKEKYQDYAMTFQKGSTVYEWNNEVIREGEGKGIQALDSNYFDHKPGLK